jgi:hypothetical protein
MELMNATRCLAAILALSLPAGLRAQRSVGKRIDTAAEVRAREAGAYGQLWQGVKFIFLEKPRPDQKQGYRGFCDKENCPLIEFSALEYGKFLGKTMTAVDVKLNDAGIFVVKFQLDGGTGFVYGTPNRSGDWIASIAPAGDLEKAKARWLGRTVYATATTKALSTYDAERDEFGEIPVKNLEPLKVIDVWRGFDANRPVWLIVERRNGEQGFIATTVSWTKYNTFWREGRKPGEREVHDADPRARLNWPPPVWRAIEERALRPNMTREQVLMSWGEPDKTEQVAGPGGGEERWTYQDQTVSFVGNGMR